MKATKDRIIEVAIHNIKSMGQISNLTMASLAQDANIGKSTIYEYFKSKKEVVKEAITKIVECYTSGFLRLKLTTFEDSFFSHMQYLMDSIEECWSFARVINRENKSIKVISEETMKLICKSQEIYIKRMMEIFHLGFLENKIKNDITSDDYVIMGLLNGIFGLYGSKQIQDQKEEIIKNLYRTILKIEG